MAEADSSQEYSSDESEPGPEFEYHRGRGRTRKEDSWLRRYRKKVQKHRSPDSEERRSLSPYTCITNKKYTKGKKTKKFKKKIKKDESETPILTKDSLAVRDTDTNREGCHTGAQEKQGAK